MPDDVIDRLTSPPNDAVLLNEEFVARVISDLGIVGAHDAERFRDALLKIVEDPSGTPFSMRVGQWSVKVPGRTLRAALQSTLMVLGLQSVGARSPVVVLAATLPFLVDIERVRFHPDEREVTAEMRLDITDRDARGDLWARLPDDIRHELTYLRLAELAELLERSGSIAKQPNSSAPVFRQRLTESSDPGRPAAQDLAVSDRPPQVLLVADEWFPAKGGISSLNRYLAFGLAATGADVCCLVPIASAEELTDARRQDVRLVQHAQLPRSHPGTTPVSYSALPTDLAPDIVVGHSRVTGPQAKALRDELYPAARLFHFVHSIPDYLEWSKIGREVDAGTRAESRSDLEESLALGADCVVAVGPMLHEWFSKVLAPFDSPPPLLRFDPGFDHTAGRARVPSLGRPQILMLGRLDDAVPKGVDIAAAAVGWAIEMAGRKGAGFDLVLRGSTEGQAEELRQAVRQWSKQTTLRVIVRNYTTEVDRLAIELSRADLLLMPSRTEAFGLVGLEAIVAGTPLLATDQSGLAMLLEEHLPPELLDRVVVPVLDDPDKDAVHWGHAIAAVMRDRGASFTTAATVRESMSSARSWARACTGLIDVWRAVRN